MALLFALLLGPPLGMVLGSVLPWFLFSNEAYAAGMGGIVFGYAGAMGFGLPLVKILEKNGKPVFFWSVIAGPVLGVIISLPFLLLPSGAIISEVIILGASCGFFTALATSGIYVGIGYCLEKIRPV